MYTCVISFLSVMVIDHSIMQTFQLRKTTSFYFGKIKVIFYNDVFSLTNKQWKNICCFLQSKDSNPVFFHSSSFSIFPLFSDHLLNCSDWTNPKQGVLLNWVKNSGLYYKKHQTGIFMKIITFLQIVRSGKITASQKANLSINKRFLSINSKSAKNTSISKANVFQRNFEYTFDLKGNDQASPSCCCFLMDILENGSSCYGLEAEICISTDFQPCWGKCHGFKKQSDQLWGHDFFL